MTAAAYFFLLGVGAAVAFLLGWRAQQRPCHEDPYTRYKRELQGRSDLDRSAIKRRTDT